MLAPKRLLLLALIIAACDPRASPPSTALPVVVSGNLRRPQGVYAHIPVSSILSQVPSAPVPAWKDYFSCLFADMLANPAVSGLEIGIHWSTLEPDPPGPPQLPLNVHWDVLEWAFTAVRNYNAQGGTQKSIELIVIPGFDSPSWLLGGLPSCDHLFTGGAAPNCESVTFHGYTEAGGGESPILPLPWSFNYNKAWQAFVGALATRYGDDPALVSVAITGPSAASSEMFLPNDTNTPPQLFPHQLPGCTNGMPSTCCNPGNEPMCKLPSTMWETLLENQFSDPSYYKSDKAIVEAFESDINLFESQFKNVTLILTPAAGTGLVNFYHPNYTAPSNWFYNNACNDPDTSGLQSCAAISEILDYFLHYPQNATLPDNGNGKGTQTSGLQASTAVLASSDYGPPGSRQIAMHTAGNPSENQMIAGAQFDHAFSDPTYRSYGEFSPEICGEKHNPFVPEQDAFNVLATWFNQTGGTHFFGAVTGTGNQPVNFLQISYADIQWAEQHETSCYSGPAPNYSDLLCNPIGFTAQALISTASDDLFLYGLPAGSPPAGSFSCPTAVCSPPPPVL